MQATMNMVSGKRFEEILISYVRTNEVDLIGGKMKLRLGNDSLVYLNDRLSTLHNGAESSSCSIIHSEVLNDEDITARSSFVGSEKNRSKGIDNTDVVPLLLRTFFQKIKIVKIISNRHISNGTIRPIDVSCFAALRALELYKVDIPRLGNIFWLHDNCKEIASCLEALACHYCIDSLSQLLVGPNGNVEEASNFQPWIRLEYLDVSYNRIYTIDSSLKMLPSVYTLDLSHNCISILSEDLRHLISLRVLNLSFNSIESVANIYCMLGNVTTLVLSYNQLTSVAGLNRLYALESLDVSENCLESLKDLCTLGRLPVLESVYAKGNPASFHNNYRIRLLTSFSDRFNEVAIDGERSTGKEYKIVAANISEKNQHTSVSFNQPGLEILDSSRGSIENMTSEEQTDQRTAALLTPIGSVASDNSSISCSRRKKGKSRRRSAVIEEETAHLNSFCAIKNSFSRDISIAPTLAGYAVVPDTGEPSNMYREENIHIKEPFRDELSPAAMVSSPSNTCYGIPSTTPDELLLQRVRSESTNAFVERVNNIRLETGTSWLQVFDDMDKDTLSYQEPRFFDSNTDNENNSCDDTLSCENADLVTISGPEVSNVVYDEKETQFQPSPSTLATSLDEGETKNTEDLSAADALLHDVDKGSIGTMGSDTVAATESFLMAYSRHLNRSETVLEAPVDSPCEENTLAASSVDVQNDSTLTNKLTQYPISSSLPSSFITSIPVPSNIIDDDSVATHVLAGGELDGTTEFLIDVLGRNNYTKTRRIMTVTPTEVVEAHPETARAVRIHKLSGLVRVELIGGTSSNSVLMEYRPSRKEFIAVEYTFESVTEASECVGLLCPVAVSNRRIGVEETRRARHRCMACSKVFFADDVDVVIPGRSTDSADTCCPDCGSTFVVKFFGDGIKGPVDVAANNIMTVDNSHDSGDNDDYIDGSLDTEDIYPRFANDDFDCEDVDHQLALYLNLHHFTQESERLVSHIETSMLNPPRRDPERRVQVVISSRSIYIFQFRRSYDADPSKMYKLYSKRPLTSLLYVDYGIGKQSFRFEFEDAIYVFLPRDSFRTRKFLHTFTAVVRQLLNDDDSCQLIKINTHVDPNVAADLESQVWRSACSNLNDVNVGDADDEDQALLDELGVGDMTAFLEVDNADDTETSAQIKHPFELFLIYLKRKGSGSLAPLSLIVDHDYVYLVLQDHHFPGSRFANSLTPYIPSGQQFHVVSRNRIASISCIEIGIRISCEFDIVFDEVELEVSQNTNHTAIEKVSSKKLMNFFGNNSEDISIQNELKSAPAWSLVTETPNALFEVTKALEKAFLQLYRVELPFKRLHS